MQKNKIQSCAKIFAKIYAVIKLGGIYAPSNRVLRQKNNLKNFFKTIEYLKNM